MQVVDLMSQAGVVKNGSKMHCCPWSRTLIKIVSKGGGKASAC